MATGLMLLGVFIAMSSVLFALYNMYHSFNKQNAFENTFKRHIMAMGGLFFGMIMLVSGIALKAAQLLP